MGVLMFSCGHKNRIYINTDKVSSLAIVFLSLALVACGSVPHPDLNVKTPSAWRNSAVSTSTSASNEAWWTALKDPVLNDAVELALKNNLNVAQSYERLNAERA